MATVYPGSASQPVASTTVGVNGWRIGDKLVVSLTNPAATCATAGTGLGFSSAPTVTAAPTSPVVPGEVQPTFSAALSSSSSACATQGINDLLTITFTNADAAFGPGSVVGSVLSLTNVLATVGASLTGNVSLAVDAVEGNGNTAPTDPLSVVVAQIALARVATTPTTGAPGATISAPTITITEVTANTVGADATFTLSDGVWASAGTLSVPAGAAAGSPTGVGTPTLTYGLTYAPPTPTTPGIFTLSGATVTLSPLSPTGHAAVTVNPDGIGAIPYISAINQTRVAGDDRYATAAKAFLAGDGPGSGVAVLATGLNFPDALAANALAGAQGTGVLLTKTNVLPDVTRAALVDAASGSSLTVYIVGGPDVVSSKVVDQIRALGLNPAIGGDVLNPVRVIRVSGADRIKTAEAVAERVSAGAAAVNGISAATTAIVATGWNYPDALAIAPASYANTLPLFLTKSDGTLMDSTVDALAAAGVDNVILVGGTDVIPASVETQLKASYNVLRLQGATRYDTAAAIATWELQAPSATNGGGLSWAAAPAAPIAYLATGTNFPDALSGGALAGYNASPVLLTPLSATETGLLQTQTANVFSAVTALGGTDVVSNTVRTAAAVATAG